MTPATCTPPPPPRRPPPPPPPPASVPAAAAASAAAAVAVSSATIVGSSLAPQRLGVAQPPRLRLCRRARLGARDSFVARFAAAASVCRSARRRATTAPCQAPIARRSMPRSLSAPPSPAARAAHPPPRRGVHTERLIAARCENVACHLAASVITWAHPHPPQRRRAARRSPRSAARAPSAPRGAGGGGGGERAERAAFGRATALVEHGSAAREGAPRAADAEGDALVVSAAEEDLERRPQHAVLAHAVALLLQRARALRRAVALLLEVLAPPAHRLAHGAAPRHEDADERPAHPPPRARRASASSSPSASGSAPPSPHRALCRRAAASAAAPSTGGAPASAPPRRRLRRRRRGGRARRRRYAPADAAGCRAPRRQRRVVVARRARRRRHRERAEWVAHGVRGLESPSNCAAACATTARSAGWLCGCLDHVRVELQGGSVYETALITSRAAGVRAVYTL